METSLPSPPFFAVFVGVATIQALKRQMGAQDAHSEERG